MFLRGLLACKVCPQRWQHWQHWQHDQRCRRELQRPPRPSRARSPGDADSQQGMERGHGEAGVADVERAAIQNGGVV